MADWRDSGHPFSSAVPSNSFWIHALHGRKCSCHDKTEQCLISQTALKQNHKQFILQCNNYVQIIIKNFLSHSQKGECTRNQTSVSSLISRIISCSHLLCKEVATGNLGFGCAHIHSD